MSPKVQAELVRAISSLSHAEIGTLALEFGVEAPGYTRNDRALSFVKAVAQGGSTELRNLTQRRLQMYPDWQIESASNLLHALELDGLTFSNGKLLPTSPQPVALGPEISELEEKLLANQWTVELTHFQQAAGNFVAGNFEAANGQVRSFVEGFFIQLGIKHAGKTASDPSAALQYLRTAGWLDDAEWNQFRSFWNGIQDNGPHKGLSSHHESLFRLHSATAIARYLLGKE